MHNFSRREFLKWIRYSSAGLVTCGAALPKLFGEQQGPPRNPIPRTIPIPTQPIQVVGLARNSFNMIALGDSIMWGQGLPDSMKFRNTVANWIEAQFQGTRKVNQVCRAHSGARTGWGAYPADTNGADPDTFYVSRNGYPYQGEVPFGYPSVSFQIGKAVADFQARGIGPADVDLVLLGSGANDISISNILDVAKVETNLGKGELANGPNWVRTNTNSMVVGHMKNLLPQVMSQFPNAAIVMTGYYPPVSESSDLLLLTAYLAILGLPAGIAGGLIGLGPDVLADIGFVLKGSILVAPALRSALALRSQAFAQTALNGFSDLVNQANQGLASPRVALAWPQFYDDNCYGAPNRYLFAAAEYLGDEMRGRRGQAPAGDWSTKSGIAYYRSEECSKYFPSDPTCYDASIGHPNELGAAAYAAAITGQLQTTLQVKLGLPVPRSMTLRIVQSGTEQLPSRSSNNRLLTWHWVVVSAADAQTGAPVAGASVFVNSPGGQDLGPANLSYHWYTGPTGQKIFYICNPSQAPARNLPGSPAMVGAGPQAGAIPCALFVTAPGYNSKSLTSP